MPIWVNEGGAHYELNEIWVNEGGTHYELNEVWSNEGGTHYEIFSRERLLTGSLLYATGTVDGSGTAGTTGYKFSKYVPLTISSFPFTPSSYASLQRPGSTISYNLAGGIALKWASLDITNINTVSIDITTQNSLSQSSGPSGFLLCVTDVDVPTIAGSPSEFLVHKYIYTASAQTTAIGSIDVSSIQGLVDLYIIDDVGKYTKNVYSDYTFNSIIIS